jgi:hypothetical protein
MTALCVGIREDAALLGSFFPNRWQIKRLSNVINSRFSYFPQPSTRHSITEREARLRHEDGVRTRARGW